MSTSPKPGSFVSSRPAPVVTGDAAASMPAALRVNLTRTHSVPEHLLEPAREGARAEGYASGWAQGRRDAATEAAEMQALAQQTARERVNALNTALEAIARAASALEMHVAPDVDACADLLTDAAFALAETILGRELEVATEPGRDAVRRALAAAPADRPLVVSLHPGDLAEVTSTIGADTEVDGRSVTFIADPRLARGDALASSDVTDVDARISSALERARAVLGQ